MNELCFLRKAPNNMIGHRMKTFGLLCQALGVVGALRVVQEKLRGSKTVRVKVKNIPHPILARMNNCDLPTLVEVLCSSECEVELLWSPRTILDLGANIGLTAIKLKGQFPGATLIAVEPDPGSDQVCRVNLSHIPETVILQMAIGWGSGVVKCANPEAPSISRRFGICEADDPDAIREVSIAEILDQYQCRSPILIKMDIEGSEASCFENSESWLPAVQGVLVEAHSTAVANHIIEVLLREHFGVTHVGEKLFGERIT